ncbi:sugar phosphate isomerase/epimerase family protein [Algoriphagus sediminis]|uniref:Sugar phosphate isomerase/epimerase n=1 Tax=Algoriphagus sediminis TaxID=3057113 RepID=A0ABT7YB68_9BACT|nr:sugar phosphate isomerase/epimerase [Algoriphagus sediminis]MDN3203753.1 sugar phosphate isomerase/epimerase [Algoriphagus sediminis]
MKNRREFLRKATLGISGLALAPTWLEGAPAIIKNYHKNKTLIEGVKLGCITYSFRQMKDQSAEAILGYINQAGVTAVELMGDPAEEFAGKPMIGFNRMDLFMLMGKERNETITEDEKKELEEMRGSVDSYNQEVAKWREGADISKFDELKAMFNDSGVEIYAYKPSTFGKLNSDAEIDFGMRAAKALGASHVTLEHPSDDAHTMKLGKMAEQHGVSVAYHGHEQQTFTFWDTALEQSPNNALNLDIGHYIAAGNTDLMELITKQSNRISSMHVKDRQTPENGKGNVIWGNGDTPIAEVLKTMKDNSYSFPATIELEYQIPSGSNPVTEVKNCYEYCANALSQA